MPPRIAQIAGANLGPGNGAPGPNSPFCLALTNREGPSILEILQKRITVPPEPAASVDSCLDGQSTQLLGYLDALFHRLMVPRRGADEPLPEISREEIRAMIILDSGEPIMMSNLAESLGVPLSTATHTADRLVAKGLVERNRSEEDRRVVEVQLSQAGRKLQDTFREKRRGVAQSWLEPLSGGEREAFLQLMAKITLLAKPASEAPEPR